MLTHPSLLVVDEIRYPPINHSGAVLVIQLMNRPYEHASMVLTANKGLEEWSTVLGAEVMAAALIDRVLHHCHLVNIREQQVPDARAYRPTSGPSGRPRRPSCEASIGCFGREGGPFGPDLRDWKSPNPQFPKHPEAE